MQRSIKKSIACALCVSVAACATTVEAPVVAAPASAPVECETGIAKMSCGGEEGAWISDNALGDVLAGNELAAGELKLKVSLLELRNDFLLKRNDVLEKAQASTEWKLVWGPLVAFFSGMIAAGIIALGATLGLDAMNGANR